MKRSSCEFHRGPLAALVGLIALGVGAVAVAPPPYTEGVPSPYVDDDPLLAGTYPLDFGLEIELLPMTVHPDAPIAETYIRRRDVTESFFGWSDDDLDRFDRGQIDMGRFRVEPAGEPQIVLVVRNNNNCSIMFGCAAHVLTRQNDEWVMLTTFDVTSSGRGFTVAVRPFWVRPTLESGSGRQELDHGPRMVVQPLNAGRPTFVGDIYAIFWDGTQWKSGCWQRCESR